MQNELENTFLGSNCNTIIWIVIEAPFFYLQKFFCIAAINAFGKRVLIPFPEDTVFSPV